jgi:integrase
VDLSDARQPGLVLRCRASGTHSWLVRAGRGTWITLGPQSSLTITQAREEARKVLGQLALGQTPRQAPKAISTPTLKAYVVETYGPWVRTHRKTGEETVQRLQAAFAGLLATKLDNLSAFSIERWRTQRLETGARPATVNRDLNALRGCLSHAVRTKAIARHPMADVKAQKVDGRAAVRFLSAEEATRLHAALAARDDARRQERTTANAWRQARGYPPYPEIGTFSDHLTPLVVLALHTGLRRGELFGLRWADVALSQRRLMVRGDGAKSGQTRHVPLNREALRVLTTWQQDRHAVHSPEAASSDLVFPSSAGGPLDNVQTAWEGVLKAAGITAFRFHDLRHTFASWLVQAGVDLNQVRELLGHASLTMTLRYAHLAPEHGQQAVDRLVAR